MSPFQRFMAELRRRHVPQTAAVYMVAAWAAIQFADVVVPNLGWPQGVVTAVIIAAAVGFPVMLALTWFLEWGPDGIHRAHDAESPEPGEPGEPGTGTAPPSYAPWGVALGVLAVGIAGALVVAAVRGDDGTVIQGDEGAPTRFDRRQAGREAPIPPATPQLLNRDYLDSVIRMAQDSTWLQVGEGLTELDAVELARRFGEAAGRTGADGPVEIMAPLAWSVGAPEPVRPGDTLRIVGIARAAGGVAAVEVEGRVVARSGDGEPELPFEARWVAPRGTGFRELLIVVRPVEGDPVTRPFRVSLVPRTPDG